MRTYRGVDMRNGQTTISDYNGNLLFYTNCAKIYDTTNHVMMNGDSINYGAEWDDWGGVTYNWLDDVVALPTDNNNIWNLLHYYVEYNVNLYPPVYAWRVYQTQLDMMGNSSLGRVIYKNKMLVQDTLGSYVAACRHANGRDWWVLASKSSSNCLFTFLVQKDTTIEYPIQCLGGNYISGDAGQAQFSPDGTKFAWIGGPSGVNLFDFDRCTGQLNNPVQLPYYWTPYTNYQAGVAFSPNSRFLYVTQTKFVFQFDLSSSNIASSVDTIGFYTASPDSNGLTGYYFLMQLAPDGKIYISANNSVRYLHVVNEPDKPGDSCHFVNYGFRLPYGNTFGIPNYPNYRLGALTGSPCDTIAPVVTSITKNKEQDLRIYPNPATAFVTIDYGFTDWSKGDISLEVTNQIGQTVYRQPLPMYSGYQKINVSNYASGLYTATIKRQNQTVAVSKFVKE